MQNERLWITGLSSKKSGLHTMTSFLGFKIFLQFFLDVPPSTPTCQPPNGSHVSTRSGVAQRPSYFSRLARKKITTPRIIDERHN